MHDWLDSNPPLSKKSNYLGGYCTHYKAGNYNIESMMHLMIGTKPGSYYHNIWKPLGVFDNIDYFPFQVSRKVVPQIGEPFTVYSDQLKLKQEMLKFCINEKERQNVDYFIGLINKFDSKSHTNVKVADEFTLHPRVFMGNLFNPSTASIFARGIGNTSTIWSKILILNIIKNKDAMFPKGGSSALISAMENKLLQLGGKVLKNTLIEEILIEGNNAIGVKTKEGSVIKGDYIVISSDLANGYGMLSKGKYKNPRLEKALNDMDRYPPMMQANLCLNILLLDPERYALTAIYELPKPITINGDKIKNIAGRFLIGDEFAPKGHSIFQLSAYCSSTIPWSRVKNQPSKYAIEKETLTKEFVKAAISIFPKIEGHIEHVVTCDPVFYESLTANTDGVIQSFISSKRNMNYLDVIKNPFEGLSNVHLGSVWGGYYGGIHTSIENGMLAIKKIVNKWSNKSLNGINKKCVLT